MRGEGEGPSVSDKLIGAFIILFGLCMALAGGACTIAAGASLLHFGYDRLWVFVLLIFIVIAAGGLFMMRAGLRVIRSGYRRSPSDRGGTDA